MYEANVIDVANTENLRTTDVLMEQVGNYASKELEEHYAADWERANNKALVRSWEEKGDERFAGTYLARKKHFDAIRSKIKPLGMTMAPELAKEELERYARMPWSEITRATAHEVTEGGQKKQIERRINVERINELRAVLGYEPIDVTRVPAKIDNPDYEAKVAEYLKLPRADRTAFVRTTEDRTFLGYIAQDDSEREIRTLAQTRLLTLATG